MPKSSLGAAFIFVAALAFIPQIESTRLPTPEQIVPLPPQAGKVEATSTVATTSVMATAPEAPAQPKPQQEAKAQIAAAPTAPVKLSIPSISLTAPIEAVGLTSAGAMDVPGGSTHNVGWYKFGTVPGEEGSAVIDAHVFAAFAQLHKLKVGGSIYVITDSGQKLQFKITDIEEYKLGDVPADTLFNREGGKYLNLITCSGKLTPDHSTYDHRLVVYSQLVE